MLEIRELSAEIEGVQVLRRATLSLEEGATVALIGRNGAGKTSLLRAIMGFMTVTGGAISFDRTHDADAVAAHRATPHFQNYLSRIGDLAERTALVLNPVSAT